MVFCRLSGAKIITNKYPDRYTPKLGSLSSEKGPIIFHQIKAADWETDREGLIDLKDPKAIQKKIKPGPEPISIFFYSIEHPVHGKYLIDSGVAKIFTKQKSVWPINPILKSFIIPNKLKIYQSTGDYLSSSKSIKGIFLTHMHIDHILGIIDLPSESYIYTGTNEADSRKISNIFVRGTVDNLLKNREINELFFEKVDTNLTLPAIDFFEDGSLIILKVPGHTTGSLAFIISSTTGNHLILGDTCHTKIGWEDEIIPGTFTEDPLTNKISLKKLKYISKKYSITKVYPGHQNL